jgi:SAM-dependent methyltransferase
LDRQPGGEDRQPVSPNAELLRLLEAHWDQTAAHLGPDARKGMLEMLSEDRATETLDLVAARLPYPLSGRRLLEIGSGVGTLQLVARSGAIRAFGIDPSSAGARAGRCQLLERGLANTIVCAVGEELPFPNASFDVVCSSQVLEHTHDPARVLAETLRVLRPGGWFVHVFPNYGSFWEGHYGVVWFPHLPKAIGRLYLGLLGRDLTMLEELQLLSQQQVAWLMRQHAEVVIAEWGFGLWEQRVRTLNFSEWAYLGRLKQLVRWLHHLRLVSVLIRLGRHLHFETPIVLVGCKQSVAE